jgi:hypothetical protein
MTVSLMILRGEMGPLLVPELPVAPPLVMGEMLVPEL